MKKIFLSMLAAIVAFTSCTKDDLGSVENGKEVTATFSIQAPSQGVQTRASFSDPDLSGMRVFMAVMYNDKVVHKQTLTDQNLGNPVRFEVRLVTGQPYKVAVWADFGSSYYTIDEDAPKVSMKETAIIGSENKRDAYFVIKDVTLSTNETHNFILKRPFGLVNINTTDNDEDAVKNADLRASTYRTVVNMPTELSLLSGDVANSQDVTIGWNSVSEAVGDGASKELSFDYILASATQSPLSNFTMSYKNASNKDICSYEFANIPVRRNYITNITGNVLTKKGTISVTVTPAWEGTDEVSLIEVATIADLNSVISNASSETAPLNVNITGEISGTSNEVTIPDAVTVDNTPSITMNFTDVTSGAKIKVADQSGATNGNYTGTVTVVVPSVTSSTDIEISLPKAHVVVKGSLGEVIASTSPTTLVVDKGAVISSLKVKSGNVDVYGTVTSIERMTENSDAQTLVNVFSGGILTNTPNDASIIVKNIISGQIVNKTTGISYETVRDAVVAAKAGHVIELTEGNYNLGEPAQQNAEGPNGYYLLIDKTLTIQGVGNVRLYTSHEAAQNIGGTWSLQNLVTVKSSNVALKNITFEANYNAYYEGPNKTIEVVANLGDGFVMDGCALIAGSKSTDGGCLYIGGDGENSLKATVKNTTFNAAGLSVRPNTTVEVVNCTFNEIRPYWKTALSIRGKAIATSCVFNTNASVIGEEPVTALDKGVVLLNNCKFPTVDGVYWKVNDAGAVTVNNKVYARIYNVNKKTAYNTINDAISAADNGSVIRIANGDYPSIKITKSGITLIGSESTKIANADISGSISNVTIKNIEFNSPEQMPSFDDYKMLIGVRESIDNIVFDNCKFSFTGTIAKEKGIVTSSTGIGALIVKNCTFSNLETAIFINPNSDRVVIENNSISDVKYGVRFLKSNNLTVRNNTISSIQGYAIEARVGWASTDNGNVNTLIDGNILTSPIATIWTADNKQTLQVKKDNTFNGLKYTDNIMSGMKIVFGTYAGNTAAKANIAFID